MKKILALFLVFCMLCLSGCAILKELKAGMDEAIILVEDFCTALADNDFATAQGYLHPDSNPSSAELNLYVVFLEQKYSISFSDGVSFKRRVKTGSTYYDSNYDGSVYEITYKIVVGGVTTDFFFVIVENDNGSGIYSFGVEE